MLTDIQVRLSGGNTIVEFPVFVEGTRPIADTPQDLTNLLRICVSKYNQFVKQFGGSPDISVTAYEQRP